MAQSIRLQSGKTVGSNPTRTSKLPLNSPCLWYYLKSMREQFEITTTSDLTEVRDADRVRYTINDGDTMMSVSTKDPSDSDELRVTKYRNSSVKITITIEHNEIEYKDIEP